MHPFLSAFAEWLVARPALARDGYLVRCLGGAALLGRFGELTVFAAIDRGNGKGLLINRRETRVSASLRYMPFAGGS